MESSELCEHPSGKWEKQFQGELIFDSSGKKDKDHLTETRLDTGVDNSPGGSITLGGDSCVLQDFCSDPT